jgi:hypothetical protein
MFFILLEDADKPWLIEDIPEIRTEEIISELKLTVNRVATMRAGAGRGGRDREEISSQRSTNLEGDHDLPASQPNCSDTDMGRPLISTCITTADLGL